MTIPALSPNHPPTADAAAIRAAKGKLGEPAKFALDYARTLVTRATSILGVADGLRDRARRQITWLANQQTYEALAARPVTDLRDLVGRGTRLNALAESGYGTVADVLDATPYELRSAPGVGGRSAEEVSAAARQLADEVRSGVRVRFDVENQTGPHTQLLATLTAIRHADHARATLHGPVHQFASHASRLSAWAQPTTDRSAMRFKRRAKKQPALAALAQLDALLRAPETAHLVQSLDWYERAIVPEAYTADRLWPDYASDAAGFNALLSTLGGHGEDPDTSESAQGFLPSELRQTIRAVPLDTTLLTATLRNYQVFGAQYALHQEHTILGDEMGLGKTVQALAAVAHMAAKGQTRFLVVCPASVQMNWINEIEKHTVLDAHSLHGAGRDAATRLWLREGGVAVTTFGTLGKLDQVADEGIAMVIVDEAHAIKNPETQRSQAVAAVLTQAQRALLLTGTPMENRVEEFRNLIDYLQPGIARRLDAADALSGARHFRRAVAPVYLRRNQEDVLTELPDKIEVEDWVHLTPADEDAYARAVSARNLMAMRQAAFHADDSAKMDMLVEIVEEARQGDLKVLVFSYFLGVLEKIQRRLGEAVVGTLTGSVAPVQRQHLVDTFTRRTGHSVLLSQIEAGGVGLNVQAASVVVIAEPQWKPSIEEQAVARAYRMGQIRKVQVRRLLAKGSVDERLREIQEHKSLLFSEFARKSDAKEAHAAAVDPGEHRPQVLDDTAVPVEHRIIAAERHRLGID
ncbi:DEAD/DEAH box helicase [Prauserella rugosa]|uniref:SNF2 domain-containing protein n=1 Tax=Prauserella rugosa TaxID=43354 RepID=A0A660CAM0_9PSEU|nr:DEAD/DEAH box helicase [Prauserella rugosa]KMS92200.1 helicase SNF2 [Streptomyces regensis]TWH20356.1 SNF2 domain-containing protein [Prauserella rugosa]